MAILSAIVLAGSETAIPLEESKAVFSRCQVTE
jgi:hypothetical protein